MFKGFLILLLSTFLLFSCSKKNKEEQIVSEPEEEDLVLSLYAEAVEALIKGDAFYAGKKFREVESLLPPETPMYHWGDIDIGGYQILVLEELDVTTIRNFYYAF